MINIILFIYIAMSFITFICFLIKGRLIMDEGYKRKGARIILASPLCSIFSPITIIILIIRTFWNLFKMAEFGK